MLTIDLETARRFILGKQGLWPGRRFRGPKGTEGAMNLMDYLQLDPLQVIARSHDIALYGRVLDYKPGMWEEVTYEQRKFFDWGGWLAARPMDELPYWRRLMRQEREGAAGIDRRIHQNGIKYADAIGEMRTILQERGTVSNRDFKMVDRTRTISYRGRKDSSLALYYLWRTGEVMTHHRENFERVYALTESVAPEELIREAEADETVHFLIRKAVRHHGLQRLDPESKAFLYSFPFEVGPAVLEAMLEAGELVEVMVEGWKFTHYALAEEVPLLDELSAGRIPKAWKPLETDTTEETVFLSPLDPVSARGRAKPLFGFDYSWEVYKPADKRQYGYYTLPVLWGDRLVARFDSKLDRATNTFVVLGIWLEDEALGEDEAFAEALARAFGRFREFLGAEQVDFGAIEQANLRAGIIGS